MEIDFTGFSLKRKPLPTVLLVVLIILLLAGLGLFGREVTPEGSTLLTWEDWQVRKVAGQYRVELRKLQQDAEILADLVQRDPDPVRAQVVTDAVFKRLAGGGLSSLEIQRAGMERAAAAVRSWSLGSREKEAAIDLLGQAIQSIKEAADESQ
jgi:hypothetical protein